MRFHQVARRIRRIIGANSGEKKAFPVNNLDKFSAKEKFVLSSVLRLHGARFPVPLHELYLVATPHSRLRFLPIVT